MFQYSQEGTGTCLIGIIVIERLLQENLGSKVSQEDRKFAQALSEIVFCKKCALLQKLLKDLHLNKHNNQTFYKKLVAAILLINICPIGLFTFQILFTNE